MRGHGVVPMVKAILLDDELPALWELKHMLDNYPEVTVAGMFTNPHEAFKIIETEKPDAVFLDINMPLINGIDLALKIQELPFEVMIVFVTAYSRYYQQSFQANPLDCILKPIDEEHFQETMERLLEQYRSRGRS